MSGVVLAGGDTAVSDVEEVSVLVGLPLQQISKPTLSISGSCKCSKETKQGDATEWWV